MMRMITLIVVLLLTNYNVIILGYEPNPLPSYCSDNSTVRDIPVLTPKELLQVDQLKQVQVLIRHGARTIDTVEQCWLNYDVTWNNCNCTTLQIPSGYSF